MKTVLLALALSAAMSMLATAAFAQQVPGPGQHCANPGDPLGLNGSGGNGNASGNGAAGAAGGGASGGGFGTVCNGVLGKNRHRHGGHPNPGVHPKNPLPSPTHTHQ